MNEAVLYLLAAVVGYLLGAVSFTRIVGRIVVPHEDLRTTEITTPGDPDRYELHAVNASSLMGRASWPWRVLVVILDMAKVAIPALAFRYAAPSSEAYLVVVLAGVVGHVWPMYYGFYGGFGISPILGGILVVDPRALVVTLPLGLLVGFLLLDRLSAINGFTLLLPIYFVFPAGDIPAALLSVLLAAIYWYAKSTRLTRARIAAADRGGPPRAPAEEGELPGQDRSQR